MCKLGFPSERDSETFWYKGTEVPLLSRDKGTTGQAQNLAKGQPVKIRDRTRDETVQDFDSRWDKTGQSRKGHSKTEKDILKQEILSFFLKII